MITWTKLSLECMDVARLKCLHYRVSMCLNDQHALHLLIAAEWADRQDFSCIQAVHDPFRPDDWSWVSAPAEYCESAVCCVTGTTSLKAQNTITACLHAQTQLLCTWTYGTVSLWRQ